MKRKTVFIIILLVFLFIASFPLTAFLAKNFTQDGVIDDLAYHTLLFIFRFIIFAFILLIIIYENIRRNNFFEKFLTKKDEISKYPHIMNFFVKLGELSFFIIVIMFLFFIAELTSRIISPYIGAFDIQLPETIFREPNPYIMFKGKPGVGIAEGKLNEFGYVGRTPASKKMAGEYRIFFLGGSTVVNGNPPIPQLVEKNFRDNNFKNVNVYNWGVVASVSNMSLARIVYEISDLEPDLIVFYNGANDMSHPFYGDPRPGYPVNFFIYESNVFFRRVDKYPGLSLLAYNSNLLRRLFGKYFMYKFTNMKKIKQDVDYDSDEWRDKIADSYVKTVCKANIISKVFGAEFITFFQPMIFFKEKLASVEEKNNFNESRQHHLYLRDKIISKVSKIKTDLKFIDLSNFFFNCNKQIFTDLVHTNQKAKEMIAKEIYKHLITTLAIPLSRPD